MGFNEYPYTDLHEMNLDWILKKVKEMIAKWDTTKNAWNALKEFVETYFEDLDVQQEINNKLDEMAAGGELAELMQPYIDEKLPLVVAEQIADVVALQIGTVVAAQLPGVVSDQLPEIAAEAAAEAAAAEVGNWLEDHVDPDTGYVIDDSLTISLAAADAKATGKVRNEFEQLSITGVMNLQGDWVRGYTNTTSGVIETNQNWRVTHANWLSFTQDVTLTIDDGYSYNAIDSNLNLLTGTTINPLTIPAGTAFRVNLRRRTEDTSVPADVAAYAAAMKVTTIVNSINGRLSTCEALLDTSQLARSVISTGTDLNDVMDSGIYTTTYSGVHAHDPVGTNHRRTLIVHKKSDDVTFGQVMIDRDGGNIYVRAYADDTWRDWHSMFDVLSERIQNERYRPTNLNTHSHTIAHRGVPGYTPPATKPSYVMAKQMGLIIAEGDVRFTSDDVAVIFHDATYTVGGVTHVIAEETYDQFMQYDMGAAYSAEFTGTYGLSLEAFLDLCNELQLTPTLDFKVGTTQQITDCLAMIDAKRVKVFNYKASVANLKTIIDHDPHASVRLGADDYSVTLKNNLIDLIAYGSGTHTVHFIFAMGYGTWTSEQIAECKATGAIPGVSSINDNTRLLALTEDVDIIFTEYGFNATMQQTINSINS
mgnify:CR=1 FL=1